MHELALKRQRFVPFRDVFGKIAHDRLRVGLAEEGGGFVDCDSSRAEGFDHEAVAGEFFGPRQDTLDVSFVEFDDLGDQ